MLLLLAAAWAIPPITTVEDTATTFDTSLQEHFVACPAGYVALSGGTAPWGTLTGLAVVSDGPATDATGASGWFSVVQRDPSVTATFWGVQTSATCLDAAIAAQMVEVSQTGVMGNGDAARITAACPAGTTAVAGGVSVNGDLTDRGLAESAPRPGVGWRGGVVDLHPSTGENIATEITVTAWCMPDAIHRARVRVVRSSVAGGPAPRLDARCPRGTLAIAGGHQVDPMIGGVGLTWTRSTHPGRLAAGWSSAASMFEPPNTPAWTFETTAICLTR